MNCDGIIDATQDSDNDGYSGCQGDCNDQNDSINPGAIEVCDTPNSEIDNNCDGVAGNQASSKWYRDRDGDGYPISTSTYSLLSGCNITGWTQNSSVKDCNDSDKSVYPGATELCNGIDDDCDDLPDNPSDQVCRLMSEKEPQP